MNKYIDKLPTSQNGIAWVYEVQRGRGTIVRFGCKDDAELHAKASGGHITEVPVLMPRNPQLSLNLDSADEPENR